MLIIQTGGELSEDIRQKIIVKHNKYKHYKIISKQLDAPVIVKEPISPVRVNVTPI